jgi:predicted ATPase
MDTGDRRRADAASRTLPVPLTPIFGRSAEIDLVCSVLASGTVRLLTLIGPGGVGKTRLAIEIGRRIEGHFPGGVVFVPMAPLSDVALVLQRIVQTINLPEEESPIEAIVDRFAGTPVLLILDNMEHVIEAGPDLAGLLQSSGDLSLLVTSRIPLKITGENIFPVDPLELPDLAESDPATIAKSPAVSLLLSRAKAAWATYEPKIEDYDALAESCRRVDGLPLALELAGARLPIVGARRLSELLESSLDETLAGGPRDHPARLQTMRDAVAWSYDLLSPDEKALLRRLSVFVGGFTLEMAEAMVRGWGPDDGYPLTMGLAEESYLKTMGRPRYWEGDGEWDVEPLTKLQTPAVSLLESLVRQSMIKPIPDAPGPHRFEVLQTIQDFARGMLSSVEEGSIRHAHAALMVGYSDLISALLWGGEWKPIKPWVEIELDNLLAAINWLETESPPSNQLALRIADGLFPFWFSQGRTVEASRIYERLLSRPGGHPALRVDSKGVLAALYWMQEKVQQAKAILTKALPEAVALDYPTGIARQYFFLAVCAWREGNHADAAEFAAKGDYYYSLVDDELGRGLNHLVFGFSALGLNDLADARSKFEASRQYFFDSHTSQFYWGIAIADYYLGEVARREEDRATAVAYFRDALNRFVDIGDSWGIGGCVGTMATYLIEDGEWEMAARLLGAADRLCSETGAFLPPTETATHRAAADQIRERIGIDAFDAAFRRGANDTNEEIVTIALSIPREPRRSVADGVVANDELRELFTDKQYDTLKNLAAGRTPKEMATDGQVAPSTIYERIAEIKERAGLPRDATQAELVAWAIRNRLV